MSWRQLWGSQQRNIEATSTAAPVEMLVGYRAQLFREARTRAWGFVVDNHPLAFVTAAVLVPGAVAVIQPPSEMIGFARTVGWTLLMYLAIYALVLACFFFYVVPKRRLGAAVGELEEIKKKLDDALRERDATQASTNPLIAALEELDSIYRAGDAMATTFQCKGATLPRWEEAVAWNDKAVAFVKRRIFADYIAA